MTDAEIDEVAIRFAVAMTEAVLQFFAQHSNASHGNEQDVAWEWRGHHSIAIRDAALDGQRVQA